LCMIRKTGEFGILKGRAFPIYSTLPCAGLGPASYARVVPNAKILYKGLTDFANSAFEDFRQLDAEIKAYIISTSYQLFYVLDGAYRAVHYFPHDNTLFLSYTCYINREALATFLDDCPHELNRKDAIGEIEKNINGSERPTKKLFKKVKPLDKEFLGLLGLAIWNNELLTMNGKLENLALINREAILKELQTMYKHEGKMDYATRLGELLCLLVNIEVRLPEKNGVPAKEDLEVYRLMNLFNEA
ncbi:hypothetical protein PFISCL1PPCAC_13505, partial [Pristionchus fissidentatus]